MKVQRACSLCGTPVPGAEHPGKEVFCCTGCAHVHAILASLPAGQGQAILEQARATGIIPAGAAALAAQPEPGPAAGAPATPQQGGRAAGAAVAAAGAERVERFALEGLRCPSCAWLVGMLLLRRPGVRQAEADFLSDSVRVTYDQRRSSPQELAAALDGTGYRLRPLGRSDPADEGAVRGLDLRTLSSFFLAANIMGLAAVHWSGALVGLPRLDELRVALLELLLLVPLLLLGLVPLLRSSLALLRQGRAGMDLLYVLGAGAACGLSLTAFFRDDAEFYFDTCAAFIAISLCGRLIEGRLRRRATGELSRLLRLDATKVAVLPSPEAAPAARRWLPLDRVEPGTVIEVQAEELLPLDAEWLGDPGAVDEAMLTGEPTPVPRRQGDTVWAGSRVLTGPCRARTLRRWQEGRLQQIAGAMAGALAHGELRLRSADRLAGFFVLAVLGVAAAAWVLRLLLVPGASVGSAAVWLPAIAVLMAACPCAFGLASAVSLAVAVGALLRQGVLVRDGAALERLASTDLLVLDKTGTLTAGRWGIRELRWGQAPDRELLAAVAGAEAGVEHPVARALRDGLAREPELVPLQPDGEVRALPGKGLIARFGPRELRVGTPELVPPPPGLLAGLDERTSVVCFGWGEAAAGCFLLEDTLRPEAGDALVRLRGLGIEPLILSGDRHAVVQAVGRSLGLPSAATRGGLDPAEKQALVLAASARGRRVAFAGDGSNDGPAMAAADVAIALRHGTDLALSAAQIVPLAGGLEVLPRLWDAARQTACVIRRNYWWAACYNAVCVPVAACGWLHPILAAGLMFGSSLTVLLLSLRLGPAIMLLRPPP